MKIIGGKALAGAILATILSVSTVLAQETKLAQNLPGTQTAPAVGGDILNPLPGESILDQQPMIAVKTSFSDASYRPQHYQALCGRCRCHSGSHSQFRVCVLHVFRYL